MCLGGSRAQVGTTLTLPSRLLLALGPPPGRYQGQRPNHNQTTVFHIRTSWIVDPTVNMDQHQHRLLYHADQVSLVSVHATCKPAPHV